MQIPNLEQEIIVVDDGSKDGTREISETFEKVKVVFHEHNRVKGCAIKTGIRHAMGQILIIQDADLEYDPNDYAEVFQPILSGDCELVVGSRFVWSQPLFFTENGDPFFSHYVANRAIILITNLLYGQNHTDYEGCYEAFTKSLADLVRVQTDGFDFDNELICKSIRLGYQIVEVPIEYTPRIYSEGKKIGWRDGLHNFKNNSSMAVLPYRNKGAIRLRDFRKLSGENRNLN